MKSLSLIVVLVLTVFLGCSDNGTPDSVEEVLPTPTTGEAPKREPYKPDFRVEEPSYPEDVDSDTDLDPRDTDTDSDMADSDTVDLPADPPKSSLIFRYQESTSLYCKGTCNPSVGFIVGILEDDAPYVCTGSLIGKNTILTNSHCIPDDLKKNPNRKCTDRISIRFAPGGGFVTDVFYCADIVFASEIDDTLADNEDYAIMTINRLTDRPVLKTQRQPIEEGEAYRFVKVNPTSDDFGIWGQMETVEDCLPVMNTLMAPSYLDPYFSTISFYGCEAVGGNSGGPILNSTGNVSAVIFGGINKQAVRDAGIDQLGPISFKVTLGTSLACLENDRFGSPLAGCQDRVPRIQRAEEREADELTRQVQAADAKVLEGFYQQEYKWSALRPQVLDIATVDGSFGLEFERSLNFGPSCLDLEKLTGDSWRGYFVTEAKITHRMKLDKYWRATINGEESSYLTMGRSYMTAQLESEGLKGRYSFMGRNGERQTRQIGLCPAVSPSRLTLSDARHEIHLNDLWTRMIQNLLVY